MSQRLLIEDLGDGRITVSLQRDGQAYAEAATPSISFVSPLTSNDLENLRWYIEDYLAAPYAVYEERGQAVAASLKVWGHSLFESVFGKGKPGRDAYLQAREGETELGVVSRSAAFMALPWELLWDPQRATPLALAIGSLDRTLVSQAAAAAVPPGDVLRVLMVIARPAGLGDVGYQMIARPLMERLDAVRGKVQLEVLRPPTFEEFQAKVHAASADGKPYHIVHFDGHGTFGEIQRPSRGRGNAADASTGFLAFEAKGGEIDLITGEAFALSVNHAQVPLVVLNACRSGTVGQAAVEAAIAARLLEGGAGSVVAMSYSVYAIAAAEFMAAFYDALFAGDTISVAVTSGRQRLFRHKSRPSPKGMMPLDDWIVPVHYSRRAVRFSALRTNRSGGTFSLDVLLTEMRSNSPAEAENVSAADALAPIGRFVGRDAAFYSLELALQWQHVVIVHGPAGTGKTELAKAFGRWWRDSGGVDDPDWVIFHSFEPGIATFGLDGVITAIGLRVFGSAFIGDTSDANERQRVIVKVLRERRLLLIWDNFESVYSLPDASGGTRALDVIERRRMSEFLQEIARTGSKSAIIVTSRSPETWLGELRRLQLGGLTPLESAEMAEDVLRPYPTARLRRQDRAYAELLMWMNGHPLSVRLLLPHLEQVSPAALLSSLKGETEQLPPGFVGEGRLAFLGASLKYSLDHLDPAIREPLAVLSLFEAVVDEDVLTVFSTVDGLSQRYANRDKLSWSTALRRLVEVGVLTDLGCGMYDLHPALPSYLMADWRERAGPAFEDERSSLEQALLQSYARFGIYLSRELQSGDAEMAFALIERQRRTMGRFLALALVGGRFDLAQAIMQPLNDFWKFRGLALEAQLWVDRCREALEDHQGNPPDLDGDAGSLWLFALGTEASLMLLARDLKSAYDIYDAIRRRLDASTGPLRDRRRAVTYHQLGMVAEEREDLDEAERWYRKSLEIKEALGNRSEIASTYHQLGVIAQERGDLDGAERWYRKSLEIEEEVGNRWGMASSYHQLGVVAQEHNDLDGAERWYLKALEIQEALGNRSEIASTYHQLGMVADRRGDLDRAERWYRKSLEIEEALGNRSWVASTYHQLGVVAQERGDLDGAERWYRKSLEIEEKLGNRSGMASSYHQLGMVAQERDDLDGAERWYRKSLEIEEKLGNRSGMASTYHQLGLAARRRDDLDGAERWYLKALEIQEALGNRSGMALSYHQLGMVAQIRDDLDGAERWYLEALKIEEAVGNRLMIVANYLKLAYLAEHKGDHGLALDFMTHAVDPDSPTAMIDVALHYLAKLTRSLGFSALEASWQRIKGVPLPETVRNSVVRLLKDQK